MCSARAINRGDRRKLSGGTDAALRAVQTPGVARIPENPLANSLCGRLLGNVDVLRKSAVKCRLGQSPHKPFCSMVNAILSSGIYIGFVSIAVLFDRGHVFIGYRRRSRR
jgi:hypothetical protein